MSEYRGDEYFVDNGTLMHYGVKGMKWKNHKYVDYNDRRILNGRANGVDYASRALKTTQDIINKPLGSTKVRVMKNMTSNLGISEAKARNEHNKRYGNKRQWQQQAGRAAGERYAANRVLNGESRDARLNKYGPELSRAKDIVRGRLHKATQNAAAYSSVRNSRSDISNALHDFKDDVRGKAAIARAVGRGVRDGLKKSKVGKAIRGYGKEVRNTADRFVSDTADFYKNAARKARNSKVGKAIRGYGKEVRNTADRFVSNTADFYKNAINKVRNKFNKKKR